MIFINLQRVFIMRIENISYNNRNYYSQKQKVNFQLYQNNCLLPNNKNVTFKGVKEFSSEFLEKGKNIYNQTKENLSDITKIFGKNSVEETKESISDISKLFENNHVEMTKEQAEFIKEYLDLENQIKIKYAKKIAAVKDGFWDNFTNRSEKKRAKLREEENRELAIAYQFQKAFEAREIESRELKKQIVIKANDLNFSKEIIIAFENAMATNEKRIEISKRKQELAKNSGFKSLAGYINEKMELQTGFIDKLDDEKAGKYLANKLPNAILFYGPTGCGKTTFAKALAQEADCNFVILSCSGKQKEKEKQFMNKLFGYIDEDGTEHTGIADTAQQNFLKTGKRTIVLIDEFDRFFGKDVSPKFINGLKGFMNKCSEENHITFFLTSNIPQKIPYELRNSHRIGITVNLDPPDKNNAKDVMEYYLNNIPKEEINYDKILNEIFKYAPDEIYSNSHLKSICDIAIEEIKPADMPLTTDMVLKAIEQHKQSSDNPDLIRITKNYLDAYESDKQNI